MPSDHASSDADFPGAFAHRCRLRVLLPLALPGPLDYGAVAGPGLGPGAFVRVPLGTRERIGVVWDEAGEGATEGPEASASRMCSKF